MFAIGWGGAVSAAICCRFEPEVNGAYISESADSYLLVRLVGKNLQFRGFGPRSSWSGVCAADDNSDWTCHAEMQSEGGTFQAVTSTLSFDLGEDRLIETWGVTSARDADSTTTNWNRLVPSAK